MAARPLETPRSLPSSLQAVAAAVTGAAHPPRFTTGPATRRALAAAGALGATTGSVIHLTGPPERVPAAVLVHELTHARRPVRRPRFLLDRVGGHGGAAGEVDEDERNALTAGARAAMGSPVAAGLVGQLPVGGGAGPMADLATRAARAAVIGATASPMAATGALAQTGWGAGHLNGGPTSGGPTSGPTSGGAISGGATSGGTISGATSGGAIGGWTDSTTGTGAATGATGDGGAGTPTTAAAANAGAPGSPPLDMDAVLDAVEERLLREIERRGGRWAGVF